MIPNLYGRSTPPTRSRSRQFWEGLILMTPIVECWLSPFKNVKSKFRNIKFSDTTTTHRELFIAHPTVDDLISITNDSKICIMRNNNGLPAPRRFMNCRYELRSNCLVIEILFRLIEQQGCRSEINNKIKKCEYKSTLPR